MTIPRPTTQPAHMTLHSPPPFIPLLPSKQIGAKIDNELIRSFHANSGIDIVCLTRQIDSGECGEKPPAVMGEEYTSGGKVVAAANGVTRG